MLCAYEYIDAMCALFLRYIKFYNNVISIGYRARVRLTIWRAIVFFFLFKFKQAHEVETFCVYIFQTYHWTTNSVPNKLEINSQCSCPEQSNNNNNKIVSIDHRKKERNTVTYAYTP